MDKAKKLQIEIQNIFGDAPVNLVGGSVRDIILGDEPKDWDYCTPLDPDEIEAKIRESKRRPYLIGKRFGTVGFKVKVDDDWQYIEVTTYRTEKYDGISRKPQVDFTDDLMLDLSRRDFTINAIVLQDDGTYFDPHGGRLDILAKKIKAVGKGKDRIQEDPLRMLRAARFAARLGFDIDPNFIGVMRQNADTILRVSKERWVMELDKLLESPFATKGLEVLLQTDVLKYILPEVWLSFQDPICKENTYKQIEKMNLDSEFLLDDKWGVLTYYIGFPYTKQESKDKITFPGNREVRKELSIGLCSRLKFSNTRTESMLKIPVTEIKRIDTNNG